MQYKLPLTTSIIAIWFWINFWLFCESTRVRILQNKSKTNDIADWQDFIPLWMKHYYPSNYESMKHVIKLLSLQAFKDKSYFCQ